MTEDLTAASFYGPVRFAGDAVAGDKIINLPAARPPKPAQLPPDLPDFTGRDAALRHLDTLRDSGDRPGMSIAVVHGMPGIGKTSLAVHWAHQVADRFPDGQLFVDLGGRPSGTRLAPHIALARLLRALGVPTSLIPADRTERAALYRSEVAGRRFLLVLDDAATAEQVRPLLPGSSGSVTIITSREGLTGMVARHGAKAVRLDLFSPAESLGLLTAVVGQERVSAEPRAARDLIKLCAHQPMALRITAANLAVHPAQAIGEAAGELIRGGDPLAIALHSDPGEAVKVAFDAAYQDLHPDQRRAFRYLGLLDRIDISTEGAAALLDRPLQTAVRLLLDLQRVNLVEATGPDRYRLPELPHGYAEDRGRAEDTEQARREAVRRLISWLRAQAEQSLNAIARAYELLAEPTEAARFRTLGTVAHDDYLYGVDHQP